MGSAPWSGKIAHAAEQLSPHATTSELCFGAWEPQLPSLCALGAVLCGEGSPDHSEEPVHRNEEEPPLAETRESLEDSA